MMAWRWLLACAIVTGAPTAISRDARLVGLRRIWVDPVSVPLGPATLRICNPHVATSVLSVDGVALGQAPPLGEVQVRKVPARVYTVGWTTPDGFTREARITAPGRAGYCRSSAR